MSVEIIFIQMCQQFGVPAPKLEYIFAPGRKFRFDYAIPEYKLAIETEGGIWQKGGTGHSHPTGIVRDMEKYTLAATLGWRVIRVQPKDLLKMDTINAIKKAMEWKIIPA